MSQDPLKLSGIEPQYRPGETVRGTVAWSLSKPPKLLIANLFWRTDGRGDTDLKVVASQEFPEPGSMGSRGFELKIPEGPFSFSGKLISLSWGVEIVAGNGRDSARELFLMTPDGKEISIG